MKPTKALFFELMYDFQSERWNEFELPKLSLRELEKAPVNVQPSAETTPPWEITVEGPGWLAGVNGTVGSHGVTSNVDIAFTDILKRMNAIASFGARGPKGPIWCVWRLSLPGRSDLGSRERSGV